jgi:UDP-N-acetylglucosamine:LPS N-acetylglucosamine transferase|tara:strand:- start:20750 stop:21220 length:471 start_codon:yes stop_codon:yes gene_type:complete
MGALTQGKKSRLLAVASGGGHWVQLMRMRPAFADFDMVYVSTLAGYEHMVAGAPLYLVADSSRFDPRPLAPTFLKAFRIFLKHRPSVVVTTGSAPALPFMMLGRLFGCRTLWVDSIANSERLSGSGRIARKLATKVISQWPDVAQSEGVECWGRVI